MRVAGIDPGLGGALALLEDGRYLDCVDMPTMLRTKSSKKQHVNAAEVARVLREWRPDAAILELVVNLRRPDGKVCPVCKQPKIGTAAAVAFGDSSGVIRGITAGLAIELHVVSPQAWKKRAGLIRASKEASRARAINLWPMAPLARKKDHGRAEALLIARFGVPALDADPAKADPFELHRTLYA